MALSAQTIWEVETGGDDTNNGGAFDPSQTAGMFTDGAATVANTSAPVFSSASYNFVAGDVGAWVFIASGTNWTPGWYKITSVASNKATLVGTIGLAVVALNGTITAFTTQLGPSTVVGCATTASPTGATWSIDYSQQASAQYTYTDLASAGTGLTVSSAAKPFAKEQVGNSIVITGGTNFNAGRYVIASVASSVATVVGPGNITTGAGASGTGGQGGAAKSIGLVSSVLVNANRLFVKTGSYTISSATANIAGGCFSNNNALLIEGYNAVRGDLLAAGVTDTRPTLTASGISTFTVISSTGNGTTVRCLIIDGASLTSSRGISLTGGSGGGTGYYLFAKNCTNNGLSIIHAIRCSATGCATQVALSASYAHSCVVYSNTVTGFSVGGLCINCIAYSNSGASSDGFTNNSNNQSFYNCVSYGNGRDGFRVGNNGNNFINCVAEANTGVGFTGTSSSTFLLNCAVYNNTGGAFSLTGFIGYKIGTITYTTSAFTNAGSGDFSLNTTAGGGASLRAAGYPGLFPVELTTGYLDIGAAQHADPAGGGQSVSIFGN